MGEITFFDQYEVCSTSRRRELQSDESKNIFPELCINFYMLLSSLKERKFYFSPSATNFRLVRNRYLHEGPRTSGSASPLVFTRLGESYFIWHTKATKVLFPVGCCGETKHFRSQACKNLLHAPIVWKIVFPAYCSDKKSYNSHTILTD